MASTEQWLSALQDAGVCFEVTPDGRLRYSAPSGTLTATQLDELRARKHEVIDCLKRETGGSAPDADIRGTPDRFAPATSAQKGMWFLEQLGNIGAAYHLPMVLLIEGPVQIAALERALNELLQRHEALRTTLHDIEGELQQRIHPARPGDLTFTVCDATGTSQASRERWLREQIDAPFDLERVPLIRAALLQTAGLAYTLVLSMHHVICDGWSAGILRRELMQLYETFCAGQAPRPRAPATQLAEFARWERSWMRGTQRQAELAYWKQQLRDLPQQLELPYDRMGPQVPTYRGGYARVDFAPELVNGIERLQREQQGTPFMIVLAAFQIALARWSCASDIVVGSPVAVRSRPETESIVGPLVNVVLFRTRIDRNDSFAETLQRIRRMSLEALAHHRLPFDALVAQLSPERRGQRQPLMQVMFSWNQRDTQAAGGQEARFSPLFVPSSFAKVDLSLFIFETPPRSGMPRALEAGIEFATDHFDVDTIERFLEQMKALLGAAVDDPTRPVWQLPMMSTRARAQLITDWNRTDRPVSGHSVVQAFGATAAASPHATAVRDGRCKLTYAELDIQSSRLANYLRSCGADREAIVGLLLPRSIDAVIAILGILKAGGAYLPLDPKHPGERQRYMIENARATLIVTNQRLAMRLPQTTATVIRVDARRADIEREPSVIRPVVILPGNLAYVIYTSGSTGRPKGAMISHGALMNYLSFAIAAFDVGGGEGAPITTSLCFDATVTTLFTPLLTGTSVHVAADAEDDVDALTAMLAVERPYSMLKATPAHLEFMRHAYAPSDLANQARTVAVGGETLQASTIAHWREHSPRVRLINLYGPTETVVGCATYEVTTHSPHDGSIPIGRPIWNTQLYVLDAYFEPVPIGVIGELFIAGAGVARGYANQPGLTAERFLPDLFGPAGARMYRTGDRVRHLSTGELDFVGRTDHQVKLRGYRIETGEVEAALSSHEDVAQTVVVLREDAPGDKRLVGYLVARESCAINLESVRTHAAKRLPDYMLPSAFLVLASLPLTTNGKVDRKALPAPVAEASAGFCAPRTRLEAIVAAEWASVLRLDRVGIHDDFFRLGGHSLLAARIVASLRERIGAEVSLRWMFEAATVARLAALVEAAEPGDQGRREHSIVPRLLDAAIPLSFEEEQLWFLEKLGLSGSAYNVPLALRLVGALDIEALALAFAALVRRHEILRTRFPERRGSPIQIMDPAGEVLLTREYLTNAHHMEEQVRARVRLEMLHKFDVENGPLVRASLLQLGPQEHVLCLNLHHIICDAATLRILLGDLSRLYCEAREQRVVVPDPPCIQYADYAVWQRSPGRSTKRAESLAYWRGRLDGAPLSLDLPTDGRRSTVSSAAGAVETVVIPEALGAALASLTRNAGATPFMMQLGAYAILLSRWSGQNDIVIGCPVSGRSQPEIQDVAGYFVNTLPLRVTLGRVSFRELLQQIRETVVDAFAHQDVPLMQLANELHAVRDPTRHPLFQVMLVVEETSTTDLLNFPGIRTSAIDAGWLTAKADLTLSIKQDGSSIVGRIEYATTLFEARTVCELGRQWCALLAAVVARPDAPVHELSLLEYGERERLLALGSGGRLDVRPDATTVHGLFEVQATMRPNAVAASLGTQQLTYSALNARANQLAHALRAAGVTAETPVAICLDRSLDLVVAILGVLKSGGAYVPIDPAYPAERIGYTLQDSNSAILVTASRCSVPGITAARVLQLDADADAIARHPVTNPQLFTASNHLLYRLYTSGSTGRPKGTDVTHGNVVRLFSATESWFQFRPDDVWTLFHSYAFDFSVWELFGALLYGGRLVIVPVATARSPETFHQLLLDESVTVLNQTPSAFRQLQIVAERVPPDRRLERLRFVIFGGEAFQPATLSSWFAVYGATGPQLINMYGITETTVHVTFRPITPRDLDSPCRSPMGIPIPDLELHLLGPTLEPAAINCTGELYVAGAGLSRGYHRRPALSAERFVPHPHARTQGQRLYRTGDLARRRPNGELEYLGRADGQVKLRGHRIELEEIECCIIRAPRIAEAVARIRGADERDRRIVAWVVAKPGEPVDVAALRVQLTATLPAFMVPAEFMVIEKMPLTANGKLDYRNLPEPCGERSSQTQFVPPRTATERVLASVWEECLGIDTVGIDDNFFACGGDSIRAVQLVYQAREHGVNLTVALLFGRQSIRELAAVLDTDDRALVSHQPVDVQAITLSVPQGSSDAYPLSAMQEVMVREYAHHAATGRGVYHVQQLFQFTDESPSAEAMRDALAALTQAHPVLRTRFIRQSSGDVIQSVSESICLPFVERAPRDLSIEEEQQHGLEIMRNDRMQPFVLDGTAVPWRAQWMRTASDRFVLLFSIHHAVDDGWGNQQMLSQLFDLYTRAKRGEALDPERRPNVFKEFVALERELRESAESERFWRSRELPLSGRAIRARMHFGRAAGDLEEYKVALDSATLRKLRSLARRLQLQLKAVLLNAYVETLCHELSLPQLTVGVVTNGRSARLSDALNTLGLFWTMLPLPVAGEIIAERGPARMRAIHDLLASAEPHAMYPATRVAGCAALDEMFFATFNFTDFHNATELGDGKALCLRGYRGFDRFHYPLNYLFAVNRQTQRLFVHVEFDHRYFDREDIRRITDRVLARLEECTRAEL